MGQVFQVPFVIGNSSVISASRINSEGIKIDNPADSSVLPLFILGCGVNQISFLYGALYDIDNSSQFVFRADMPFGYFTARGSSYGGSITLINTEIDGSYFTPYYGYAFGFYPPVLYESFSSYESAVDALFSYQPITPSVSVPITYYPTGCILQGPSEAEQGDTVNVLVTPGPGKVIKPESIQVYNRSGLITHTYSSGILSFDVPE